MRARGRPLPLHFLSHLPSQCPFLETSKTHKYLVADERHDLSDPTGPDHDTLSTASSPPTPSVIQQPYIPRAEVAQQPQLEERSDGALRRAGTRPTTHTVADPRTAMLVWAQQRIARESPQYNTATMIVIVGTCYRPPNPEKIKVAQK